ncbi:hypothetical protein [Pedobacter metabolipauper]|uniref:Uncharacterized protein n=1 Tax=Pedobacter metabolipauper TaxID=425513 RepID=A0A4R6T2J5_9SPHI|nr:hypothetical protein [Pedobacter metabolipauper]TDQ11938.1 hypothetical protein ATK78_1068 [Pedobacter metabolipauper]
MENNKQTPKPESEDYNVEKPQDLNVPRFNSSTDKRTDAELPEIENLNDQPTDFEKERENGDLPNTHLGNKRDEDEDEQERIISK